MSENLLIKKDRIKSKIGLLPQDWKVLCFSEIFDRISDEVIIKIDQEYREIGIRSHGKGVFHKESTNGSKLGTKRVFNVVSGTLVFNIVFAWEQAVAVFTDEDEGYIASHRFPMYKAKTDLAFENFYLNFFLTPRGKYLLNLASPGGAGRNKTLGQKELSKLLIPYPSLEEQIKISKILSLWDQYINKIETLIKKKETLKKGLMQKLLTGKLRIPGFGNPIDDENDLPEGWNRCSFMEVFERVRRIDSNPNIIKKAFSISAANGFLDQKNRFKKVIAGNSLKKYTYIKKDEFAYNKGNSKSYPYGCIYRFKEDEGLIPFVYITFKAKKDIHLTFFEYYFENHMIDRALKKLISSSARSDGLLNVSVEDFFKIPITFPSKDEQVQIANVIDTATNEITELKKLLMAMIIEKKGLMQKLLTGETRVHTLE